MLNQSVKPSVHPTTFAQNFTKMLDWLCACQCNTGLRLQEGSKKPIAQKHRGDAQKHGGKLSLGDQGTILYFYQSRSGSMEMSFGN